MQGKTLTEMDVTAEMCWSGESGHKLVIDATATSKGMCFQCTSSFCLTDDGSLCCGAFSHTQRFSVPILISLAKWISRTLNNSAVTLLLLPSLNRCKAAVCQYCTVYTNIHCTCIAARMINSPSYVLL